MLIRLNKLHAKGLKENRKTDSEGNLTGLRFTLDLTNPPGDVGLVLKGIMPDDAEHFAGALVSGKEYDLKIEISEHVEAQRTLEFEKPAPEPAPEGVA